MAIKIQLKSIITCPECGHQEAETMPTDSCQFFYDCEGCSAVLRPNAGEAYGARHCVTWREGECAGLGELWWLGEDPMRGVRRWPRGHADAVVRR